MANIAETFDEEYLLMNYSASEQKLLYNQWLIMRGVFKILQEIEKKS